MSLFQEPTNRANGLTRDLQGRLLACEHDSRRVTRQELDGSLTVIANSFQGRQLNRPNDVVVKSDGCIYFTDPWTSPAAPEQWDLTFSGVYRITPDLGTMSLLIGDFVVPNGLAFSPDETVLYINDSRRGHIRAFDLMPNGTLAKQTDRVFADLRGSEPGVPDGMKVDSAGNVYCGGAGGIWIMDPTGKKLGRIEIEAVNTDPARSRVRSAPEWQLNKFNITVPEASLRSTTKSFSTAWGVSTEVGSSRISTLGLVSSARMISTRCISPTLRVCTGRRGSMSRPYSAALALMRWVTSASVRLLSRPNHTFSATVRVSNRLKCWNTMLMPSARASCGLRMCTGLPLNRIWPASGLMEP